MTMDSLKSQVIAKGKKLTSVVSASASSSAAAAAEASSLAKAAAIAKLAEIQAQAAAAEGKPAPDSSLARAASAAQLDGEEKKLDDNDEVNDPALLNAETTKELTVKLAELMKEHEAAETEWKEATAKLEAKLEDQAKSDDEQLQKKEEELTQSKATIADLEKQLEAKEAEHAKALEDMQTEKDGDVAKLKETIDGLEKEIATLKETIESKTKEDAEHTATIAKLQADIAAMEDRVKAEEAKAVSAQEAFDKEKADLEAQVHAGARERRKMHNTIQELRGNVRVFARVRPFLPGDGAADGDVPSVQPKADDVSLKLRLKGEEKKEYSFSFDRVFKPEITQEEVFSEVSEFVQSALDGYNVCLFSYGQTGSGKTHTMQGSGLGDMRGIIPRAIERVGEYKAELEAQGWKYEMRVSFLEIYNETIRDLLRDEEIGEKKHEIKVNPDGSRLVTDLSIVPLEPTDKQAVEDVMNKAAKYRTVKSTNMNDVSSRSHSVFTLHLTAVHAESNQELKGMLNLCDLAGSERLKRSGVSGDEAKEAVAINKSLSALTSVFVSLGSKSGQVPYRDTKLTWLLQPSLSGDGKTLMFCNVSPTDESSQESLSSLRFASQVNQVELGRAKKSISNVGSESGGGSTPASRRSSQNSKTPPRRAGSSASLTSPPVSSRLTQPTSSSAKK